MGLIDSHIHLDDARFDADREGLLTSARQQGVSDWVVPSVHAGRIQRVIDLQGPGIHMALGLHPYWTADHHESDLDMLEDLISQHPVVAVGECGLDHFLPDLDRDQQARYFDAQVALAKKHDLPLILHVRGAVQAVFEGLKKHQYFKAVMHSFSGSIEQAKQMVDHGIYLGFGAAGLNPRAKRLQAVIQSVPLDHLMLETDGPDQPFHDRRAKRMEPADLHRVCHEMAQLKGVSMDELAQASNHNCRTLFGL